MTMTKAEIMPLVDQAYATYNQTLYEVDKKTVYRAWYDLLWDIDYEEAHAAFLQLAITEKFMPRPGDIRRAAIDARIKVPPHLDGYSAWGVFVTLQKNAHFGTPTEIAVPEALRMTLERLGEAAYDMHTNGDREAFLRVYEKVIEQIDQHKYKISENAGRAQAFPPISDIAEDSDAQASKGQEVPTNSGIDPK